MGRGEVMEEAGQPALSGGVAHTQIAWPPVQILAGDPQGKHAGSYGHISVAKTSQQQEQSLSEHRRMRMSEQGG